jgi:hypothetical protein
VISDRALAGLLLENVDHRARPDAGGRNSYGAPVLPLPELLPMGSCTVSAPDPSWWTGARAGAGALLDLDASAETEAWEALRSELAGWIGRPVDVAFSGSGTDAEYLATLLALGAADDRPLTHVFAGSGEAGHGTELAAAGLHFTPLPPWGGPAAPGRPLEGFPAGRISIRAVPVRDAAGHPVPAAELGGLAAREVQAALDAGSRVLVHATATSKTGLLAPSRGTALRRLAGDPRVTVLVDAAQGRLSFGAVRWCLEQGWLVIFTPSKFYGGPPFAGAVLAPPGRLTGVASRRAAPAGLGEYLCRDLLPPAWTGLRRDLPRRPARGLLLRWRIGLGMIRSWWELPLERRTGLRSAFAAACERLWTIPGVEPVAPSPRTGRTGFGIASFRVAGRRGARLELDALRRVHRRLAEEGLLIGQALALGERGAALRVALGVPLAKRMLAGAARGDPHGARWLGERMAEAGARAADLAGAEPA